jgi:hypothetical protein
MGCKNTGYSKGVEAAKAFKQRTYLHWIGKIAAAAEAGEKKRGGVLRIIAGKHFFCRPPPCKKAHGPAVSVGASA